MIFYVLQILYFINYKYIKKFTCVYVFGGGKRTPIKHLKRKHRITKQTHKFKNRRGF